MTESSQQTQFPPNSTASELNGNDDVPSPHPDNDGENNDSSSSSSGDCSPSSPIQQLPIEYQLDETDLTNPEMDPLEYTFRKYVPIPRSYYWDTASEANDQNRNLPFRLKLWHNAIYYLGRCLTTAEAGGEVVANFLGVNSGPFDYVTENMTEREMEISREIVESRREERAESERRKEGFV